MEVLLPMWLIYTLASIAGLIGLGLMILGIMFLIAVSRLSWR